MVVLGPVLVRKRDPMDPVKVLLAVNLRSKEAMSVVLFELSAACQACGCSVDTYKIDLLTEVRR